MLKALIHIRMYWKNLSCFIHLKQFWSSFHHKKLEPELRVSKISHLRKKREIVVPESYTRNAVRTRQFLFSLQSVTIPPFKRNPFTFLPGFFSTSFFLVYCFYWFDAGRNHHKIGHTRFSVSFIDRTRARSIVVKYHFFSAFLFSVHIILYSWVNEMPQYKFGVCFKSVEWIWNQEQLSWIQKENSDNTISLCLYQHQNCRKNATYIAKVSAGKPQILLEENKRNKRTLWLLCLPC